MPHRISTLLRFALAITLISVFSACADGSKNSGSSGGINSNMARFVFNCDLQGVNGVLTLTVEAIATTGIIFGGGPNPEITGVIGTGSVRYLTAGELRSPVAYYVFTGSDQFADFTEVNTFDRFLVEWAINGQLLIMIIDPFGPGPTEQTCVLTDAVYL